MELSRRSPPGWSAAELAAIWSEAALLAVEDKRREIHEEDYIGGFQRVSRYRNRSRDVNPTSGNRLSITSRFRGWLKRITRQRTSVNHHGSLREFVYLDEVSVYSILASRKDGIATEFTESQTASLNSEVGSSIGIGLGASKANLNTKMQAGHVHGSSGAT